MFIPPRWSFCFLLLLGGRARVPKSVADWSILARSARIGKHLHAKQSGEKWLFAAPPDDMMRGMRASRSKIQQE
ncbi:MAG TPA: hypothetical protein VGR03_12265 [Candidatus Acidoferrum sp.]|nr:hypothetical protein [Candidatus Acidoferrum sp.]